MLDGMAYLNVHDMSPRDQEFQAVLDEFMRRKSGVPDTPFLLQTGYHALMSIRAGREAVGLDAAKVKDFLCGHQAKGASGLIKFDVHGDREGIRFATKKIAPSRTRY